MKEQSEPFLAALGDTVHVTALTAIGAPLIHLISGGKIDDLFEAGVMSTISGVPALLNDSALKGERPLIQRTKTALAILNPIILNLLFQTQMDENLRMTLFAGLIAANYSTFLLERQYQATIDATIGQ